MLSRRVTGRRGEELAAEHLRKAGYKIVERNVRSRYGEIDIVADDHGCLVFVEVRTMKSQAMHPEESVSRMKKRRMADLGLRYLQGHGRESAEWRLDVIAIELTDDGQVARFEHYQNAVEWS